MTVFKASVCVSILLSFSVSASASAQSDEFPEPPGGFDESIPPEPPLPELGPGECRVRRELDCPVGGECFEREETVCAPLDTSPVPLGVPWAIGLGLLGSGWALRRRLPKSAKIAMGASTLALGLFEAGTSHALRKTPPEYAPCHLITNVSPSAQFMVFGITPTLYAIQDLTMGFFTWELADGFANPPRWANLTGHDKYDLVGTVLGDTDTDLDRNGVVIRCHIRLDRAAVYFAADNQNASRRLFYEGVVKHEIGHCMGLHHFRELANPTNEFNRTVMNSAAWNIINSTAAHWWPSWYRYNDSEEQQIWDDLVGPFNGLMSRCPQP